MATTNGTNYGMARLILKVLACICFALALFAVRPLGLEPIAAGLLLLTLALL